MKNKVVPRAYSNIYNPHDDSSRAKANPLRSPGVVRVNSILSRGVVISTANNEKG